MLNVVEQIKKDMKDSIDKIDILKLYKTREELDKYFKMLDYMNHLENNSASETDMDISGKKTNEEEESLVKVPEKLAKEAVAEPKEEIDKLAGVFDNEKKIPGYRFERKLSGGFLIKGNIQDNIFVPESVIRTLDLKTGDIVSAELQNGSTKFNQRYDYKIVKRTEVPEETGINQFTFGIVKYESSIDSFYVEENIHKETLRYDEAPMRYIISRSEEENFNILSGDIVDISWYEGSFDKAKINWKYKTEEITDLKTISEKKLSYKDSLPNKTVNKTAKTRLLKGKTICLIGLEPYWAKYRSLIENHGGEIILVESSKHKVSRSASIRKSDLVIVGISHTSHSASIHAAEKAKDYGVKFESLEGYGGTSFLRIVFKALDVEEKVTV